MRRLWLATALIAGPLLIAVLGPFVADSDTARGGAFAARGVFGNDFIGRDVGTQLLLGGRSVVGVAVVAAAVSYLIAIPLGLFAAMTRHRWLDDALMRPLDVLLAIPALLLMLLLASVIPGNRLVLIGIVALINLPDIARIARAATIEIASRPAVDALWLQGERPARIAVSSIVPSMRRTLAADLGTRLTGVLYLVASASFLGVGVAADASDWAVMVDRNRAGLFLTPWAVLAPASLIVALSVGVNLLFDGILKAGRR